MNIINELSQTAVQSKIIEGFVLGRVDFTGSMGLGEKTLILKKF